MYNNIPQELKVLKQWVCWQAIKKTEGKVIKKPINPYTGQGAQSNNSNTWSDFETAVKASNRFNGIGFMFDNGYFGVDIDNVKDDIEQFKYAEETGREAKDNIIYEFIHKLGSYAEYSQSGNGIHIICKGSLPGGRNRKGNVEMYSKERYFIMTGNVILPEYTQILDCTEKIKPLHNKYIGGYSAKKAGTNIIIPSKSISDIIEIAKKSKQGSLFSDLLSGNWEGKYQSQSEADIAFCNMLAFWTSKDFSKIDEIFRSSGLMRSKWDELHGSETYGTITINEAISKCMDVYQPKKDKKSNAEREFRISLQKSCKFNYLKELSKYEGMQVNSIIFDEFLELNRITIKENLITNTFEIRGAPEQYSEANILNTFPIWVRDTLSLHGIKSQMETIQGLITNVADISRYNPIIDMLKENKWDGKSRFNEIYEILGITEDIYKTYIKKWFHQSVAMLFNDGSYGAEGVLVLQGEQGLGKTRFFQVISVESDWFKDGVSVDVEKTDSLIKATSYWITELGELDSTLKREQSALKAFITERFDNYRKPYAKAAIKKPRTTSFCGSVNPKEYLRDETGSRRFWSVPIKTLDLGRLHRLPKAWIKQLWIEAYQMYLKSPQGFRLTQDERMETQGRNGQFEVMMAYEQEFRDILGQLDLNNCKWYSPTEIANYVGDKTNNRISAVQAGKVLSKLSEEYPQIVKDTNNRKSTLYKFPKLYPTSYGVKIG